MSMIADEPARADDKPDLGGLLQRLCRTGRRVLPVSGMGVSVMTEDRDPVMVAASSSEAEAIEQLQFTFGEGPCQDAHALGRPVLTPHLRDVGSRRWPTYTSALLEHEVEAVFAFPLQIGAARLGALDVYRKEPGSLPVSGVVQALSFAEAASHALLHMHSGAADGGLDPDAFSVGYVVFQAQGMVQVQLGVTLAEAMVRLRAYAYAHGRTLSEVAADVVARRLRFDADS